MHHCGGQRPQKERISRARDQFPPSMIQHAEWLYLRFQLIVREFEDLPAERGLDVGYEPIRRWVTKLGTA